MFHVTHEVSCRCCGGELRTVLDLGAICPSNFVEGNEDVLGVSLTLAQCATCGLVQLHDTVELDAMYRQYWYKSSLNASMVKALNDVVTRATEHVELVDGDVVVDIGANDGTLLAMYPERLLRVGFDPALNLAKEATGKCDCFVNDYFTADSYPIPERAKIITSIAMFYDLPSPHRFVEDITKILHPEGIWVVQFTDLVSMLKINAFDNICLVPGSLLVTEKGLQAIDDLDVGDRVLTHKGRYREITRTYERMYDGSIIELQAYGMGHTIQVTPNHPILVMKDGRESWVPAEDVQVSDIVVRPVLSETTDVSEIVSPPYGTYRLESTTRKVFPVNTDFMTLAGYYLSEGFYNAKANNVCFSFGIDEDEQKLAQLCGDHLTALGCQFTIRSTRTSTIVVSSGAIGRLLDAEFGHGAKNKHIPSWVLNLPASKLKPLLDAYIAGDGYVYRNSYLRASTISQQLALDIAMAANRLGYKAAINKQHRPERCVIEGRVVSQLPLWDIIIHTDPQLQQKTWMDTKFQYARICSVKLVDYHGYVHNIEVQDDNTYVSPAMTVHNCHEHLEYYSLHMVKSIVEAHDLEIVDVEYNEVNGGSLRAYIAFAGRKEVSERVAAMLREEDEYLGLFEDPLAAFAEEVEKIRKEVTEYLLRAKFKGKSIAVLGASTKGNTLLQYFGLDDRLIDYAAEVNPDKFGLKTVGSNIQIISQDEALERNPDIFLVLPWHFIGTFLKSFRNYMNNGGTLFVPMPKPRLYNK